MIRLGKVSEETTGIKTRPMDEPMGHIGFP